MRILVSLVMAAVFSVAATAQIDVPQLASQRGQVMQRLGVTEITIDYGRPSVKEREIWGKLIPNDQVWRAGANENTTITVSSDVKINGQDLAAGRYGLHMIPGDSEWTIIFNSDSHAWGSYFYDANHDALRVNAKPTKAPFTELLTYEVPTVSRSTATFQLHWENLAVPFEVEVDLDATVSEDLSMQLTGIPGFTPKNYGIAAGWMVQNNINIALAKKWAQRANQGPPNFQTLMLSARLADMDSETEKATEYRARAIKVSTNAELNAYGYQLLQGGKVEEAIPYFVMNTDRFPKDPNCWDSLGEAYATAKQNDKAKTCFTKSLALNPPENVKQNSEMWLKRIANSE